MKRTHIVRDEKSLRDAFDEENPLRVLEGDTVVVVRPIKLSADFVVDCPVEIILAGDCEIDTCGFLFSCQWEEGKYNGRSVEIYHTEYGRKNTIGAGRFDGGA